MKNEITQASDKLYNGIRSLITATGRTVAANLNYQMCMMYYKIGRHIAEEIGYQSYERGGVLSVLSEKLTAEFGRGYNYSALTRMVKVAQQFEEEEFATVSQTLSWSHFVELATIEDRAKRLFYQQMCVAENWSVRQLRRQESGMAFERSLIAAKPEDEIIESVGRKDLTTNPEVMLKSSYILDFLGLTGYYSEKSLEDAIVAQLERFIMELGQGFAFLERQKRISIDGTDYYIDLLFYHRKLNRLVAIDLKLGKFLPEYKGQMELYLKYLQRYEQQEHEKSPIGLLLCSEGNTEHIELMMLGEENIKVAQYLTQLPDKQWFIDKLNRSIAIAQRYREEDERKNGE